MLSVGEAFRKMPSITEVMLWPPASKNVATWRGSGHPEHIFLQCFGQRHFLCKLWSLNHCQESRFSQRGKGDLHTASCQSLKHTAALMVRCLCRGKSGCVLVLWALRAVSYRAVLALFCHIVWPQQTLANPFLNAQGESKED